MSISLVFLPFGWLFYLSGAIVDFEPGFKYNTPESAWRKRHEGLPHCQRQRNGQIAMNTDEDLGEALSRNLFALGVTIMLRSTKSLILLSPLVCYMYICYYLHTNKTEVLTD